MIRMELATRLKHFRERAGLTIYEAGEKLGKSGKTISAWENGRGQPDADMLLSLCDLYSIDSISELYGEEPVAAPSADEAALLALFRGMNEEGREKVLSYASDLERTGQYKKDNQPCVVDKAQ